MNRGIPLRSFALAIATLVLLSACTDDPEPIEPNPSASAGPVKPAMPDGAREDSPTGAANFVDYWVSAFNYGAQTGDVEPMLSNATDCEPCKGYARDFERLAPSERAATPVWRLSNISVSADRDPIKVEADVEIADEQNPSVLVFVLSDRAPFELVDLYKSKS